MICAGVFMCIWGNFLQYNWHTFVCTSMYVCACNIILNVTYLIFTHTHLYIHTRTCICSTVRLQFVVKFMHFLEFLLKWFSNFTFMQPNQMQLIWGIRIQRSFTYYAYTYIYICNTWKRKSYTFDSESHLFHRHRYIHICIYICIHFIYLFFAFFHLATHHSGLTKSTVTLRAFAYRRASLVTSSIY